MQSNHAKVRKTQQIVTVGLWMFRIVWAAAGNTTATINSDVDVGPLQVCCTCQVLL